MEMDEDEDGNVRGGNLTDGTDEDDDEDDDDEEEDRDDGEGEGEGDDGGGVEVVMGDKRGEGGEEDVVVTSLSLASALREAELLERCTKPGNLTLNLDFLGVTFKVPSSSSSSAPAPSSFEPPDDDNDNDNEEDV